MIARALENPTVYDLIQLLTGARISEAKIRDLLGPVRRDMRILDVGGGTGIMAHIFDAGSDFTCMDLALDRVRIAGARGCAALVGDATRMPLVAGSIDLVIQRAVSHHLTDAEFAAMTSESSRVLKPDGRLLFLDALWDRSWIPGRILWSVDRGSHFRTEDQIRRVLETRFDFERSTTYAVYHRYFMAVARIRSNGAGGRS